MAAQAEEAGRLSACLQEGDNGKAGEQGGQVGKALELLCALLHKAPVGLGIALPQQKRIVQHALLYVLRPPPPDLLPAGPAAICICNLCE